MNELQAFMAMLARAGIGHGSRIDYNPPGTSVLVEHDGETVVDWHFDSGGKLVSVCVCE